MKQKIVTPEIMKKVVEELLLNNDYVSEDIEIIGNTIEVDFGNKKEYLEVSFDSKIDWHSKLFYELTEPEVYLKRTVVDQSDEENDDTD